jgi:hypothetical protein
VHWISIILIELAFLAFFVLYMRGIVKKYSSIGLMWFGIAFTGFALIGVSALKITSPSWAPRITETGVAQGCVAQRIWRGRSRTYIYSFLFNPSNGTPIGLTTYINLPACWRGTNRVSDGRVYRVVYLDDPTRNLKNEAIQIEVVRGADSGWRGSRDARFFGWFLLAPIGALCIFVGSIACSYHLRGQDEDSPTTDNNLPLKDDQSGLTVLKL